MSDVGSCPVCGKPRGGIFCEGCGMKFRDDGTPCVTPEQVIAASSTGDAGIADLSAQSGMPVQNIRNLASMLNLAMNSVRAADNNDIAKPPELANTSITDKTTRPPLLARHLDKELADAEDAQPAPERHAPAGAVLEVIPRLSFGYDNAFYVDESGEIFIHVSFDALGSEQDLKLRIDGDIDRPLNVNLQDRTNIDVKLVITPKRFPSSHLTFRVNYFDEREEPHCWIGEAAVNHVERPIESTSGPQIHVSSSGDVGDHQIRIDGSNAVSTLRARELEKPVRVDVSLREDDEAERQLAQTAKQDRIKAGELLLRAQRRVDQKRLEDAYKLIRQVEELGFRLRDVQGLRTRIERDLSALSYRKGRKLFEQGDIDRAYKYLNERKYLCLNQDIFNLLMDIEDLDELCQKAVTAIDEGDLERAGELVDSAIQLCPAYERVKELSCAIDDAESERNRQAEEAEQKRARHEALERRESIRIEAEARLRKLADSAAWRALFREAAVYAKTEDRDDALLETLFGRYLEALSLLPLAKIIGPSDDDAHVMIVAQKEARIGRYENNVVLLRDSSSCTGRSHGLFALTEPGTWIVRRAKGPYSDSVHPISINGDQLAENEESEIFDGDEIGFGDTVFFRARIPEGQPRALELVYDKLPEEDREVLELMRWTLMDSMARFGGGDDCQGKLDGIDGQAFLLKYEFGVFWILPVGGRVVSIDGSPLEFPRPLLHQEVITVAERDFRFFHLSAAPQLWMWDDELEERGFPL